MELTETAQNRLPKLDQHKQKEGGYSIHFVGIGSAGIGIAKALLQQESTESLLKEGGELTIYALDIDPEELDDIEEEVDNFHNRLESHDIPSDRGSVMIRQIEVPDQDDLFETLRSYREYLKREYPAYYWQPNYDPWVPADVDLDVKHQKRGVAKAIYGHHYYNTKVLKEDMQTFADRVEEADLPPQVYIAFGLGGGTGGGMVSDLARHLSHVKLGRKTPVTGIGVLPSSGDRDEYRDAIPYLALNDLDALLDHEGNEGVVDVWGELYRNPFNNGFHFVSQEPMFQQTGDLEETHEFIDSAVAQLVTRNAGVTGWNLSRLATLLSDINNPPESWPPRSLPTHDVRWVNVIAPVRPGDDFDTAIEGSLVDIAEGTEGLYGEAQVYLAGGDSLTDEQEETLTETMSEFTEHVSVKTESLEEEDHEHTLEHPQETTVIEFIPGLTKVDLALFEAGQNAYDELTESDERNIVLDHSFLMELGVMLNEPSVRFEGVAGECIWGCACWVGTPMDRVRGVGLREEAKSIIKGEHTHDHEHEHEHADDD